MVEQGIGVFDLKEPSSSVAGEVRTKVSECWKPLRETVGWLMGMLEEP